MPDISEVNESLGKLEQELSNIKSASEIIQDAKETTSKTVDEAKELNKSAVLLIQSVESLKEKLDKVDFPVRLDKIDATVSGINTGIQNIQGRVDTLERNLKDDIENKNKLVEDNIKQSQNKIIYVLIGMIILFGGSFMWLFNKIMVFNN